MIIIILLAIVVIIVIFWNIISSTGERMHRLLPLDDGEKQAIQVIVSNWHDLVLPYCRHFKIQPVLVLAMIVQESSGDPTLVNKEDPDDPEDDSIGLMQVSIKTGAWINKQKYEPNECKWFVDAQDPEYDLFVPADNVERGIKYLAWIRDYWLETQFHCSFQTKTRFRILAAKYNGGKNGDKIPMSILHSYKVMRYLDYIETLKVITYIK